MLASQAIRILPQLGTADILAVLRHEWTRTMADGGYAQVVAVDTAGAFDQVDHAGVIIKAQEAGIGGNLLAWLRDYLNGRLKLFSAHISLIHTQSGLGYQKAAFWGRRYSSSMSEI